MKRFLAIPLFRLTALGTVMVVIILSIAVAHGQTIAPAPTITSVNVVSTTGTQAVISFTYSSAAANGSLQYKVKYGPNPSAGQTQTYPSDTGWAATASGSALATLTGLSPSTTYHFVITLEDSQTPAQSTTTVDRNFATQSTTGESGNLTIDNIRADCIDTRCQVNFNTSRKAKVELRWDSAVKSSFTDYQYSVAETDFTDVFRSLAVPGSGQSNLTASSTYHYALRATAENGDVFTTADLSMNTSANSTDHTFSTGSCEGGVAIGTCSADRRLCAAGGRLVTDCTSVCGYVCPSKTTCGTGGQCFVDPELNGAPSQCNQSRCYDSSGGLIKPAPAGCYASWPKCNANTILKVRKDRGCNLWLSCATSIQTESSSAGPAENLCLSLAACNGLSSNGRCNSYLPPGQCSNDPLRFCGNDGDCTAGGTCNLPSSDAPNRSLRDLTLTTPDQVSNVANLSGNVIAGLDWNQQGGANVIQGNLPWQLMQQIGGNSQIQNGDFEYSPPDVRPWITVPENVTPPEAIHSDFENKDIGANHILVVDPVTQVAAPLNRCDKSGGGGSLVECVDSSTCASGETCALSGICRDATVPTNPKIGNSCTIDAECRPTGNTTGTCDKSDQTTPVTFSGAATQTFNAAPSEFYYAEARIRSGSGSPRVRMQFGYDNYSRFTIANSDGSTTPTFVDVTATSAWQRVTLGPLKGLSGQTRLAFVCGDNANCGSFDLDDVQVRPVLQTTSNPNYLTPSCRLYPKDSAPSCDYQDTNGTIFKGWRGYCLERDSQTGTCLSWWPVDIIKGESNIFGTNQAAGYQDRAPLYLCSESYGLERTSQATYAPPSIVTLSSPPSPGYVYADAFLPSGAPNVTFETQDNYRYYVTDQTERQPTTNRIQSSQPGYHIPKAAIQTISIARIPGTGNCAQWQDLIKFSALDFTASGTNKDFPSFGGFSSGCQERIDTTYKASETIDSSAGTSSWMIIGDPTQCGTSGLLGHNCIFAKLFFDRDGLLYQYQFSGADQEGTDINVADYNLFLTVAESCSKLVQVVDANGQNQVFAGRVNSSAYSLPDLNYKKATDLTPFGGALQPQLAATPSDWPLLPIEKPDYVNHDAPGQARGGSPYACDGLCGLVICTADPNNHCTSPAEISACQNHATNGVPDPGECAGVSLDVLSSKGSQLFTSAPAAPTSSGDDPYYAVRHIMRLFAKSFGVWNFQNGKYALTSTAGSWEPPTQLCPVNTAPAAGQCSNQNLSCNESKAVQATVNVSAGLISDQAKDQAMTNAKNQCFGTTACDGTNAQCSGGTTATYNIWAPGACTATRDSGGAVTAWTCTGICSSNQQYTKATNTPPSGPIAKYVRPAYDEKTNRDYCAIPPGVSCAGDCPTGQLATFLTSSATKLTVTGGSGSISIKFNTQADPEQVPLSTINIDWGDGNVDTFAYPFAPRSDPTKPHIFTHVYILNRAATTNCSTQTGRVVCDFAIRVQVQDNWGWCGNNSNGADCPGDPSTWQDTGLRVHLEP